MLDTFAIVSGHTPIGQLVDTVLSALGLPQLIADSKGLIQLNNWKPLSFETITDNQDELVSTLFKEISSSVTLKILTKSAAADSQGSQCIVEVKQKLLKLALEKQPNILSSTDNNEIKELIQQLIASGEGGLGNLSQSNVNTINEWLDDLVATEGGNRRKNPQTSTRFNQLSEIPRLERWFRNDSNPSKQKLISYMNILNGTPYRRSTSKITYQQMCNWFSNQRASRRSGGGRVAESCDSQYAKMALALNNGSGDTSLNGVFNLAKLMGFQPTTQLAAHDSSSSAAAAAVSASTMNSHNFAANAFKNPFVLSAMASGFDAQLMSQLHPSITSQALFDAFRASFQQEQDPQQPGSNPTSNLPLSSLPTDIPLKFNGGGRFGCGKLDGINNGRGAVAAAAEEGHHSGALHSGGAERIDGGSESPTGNDDASMESSTSEVGEEGKESNPSTPEGCLDVINAHSPVNHQSTLGCSQLQSAAASLLNGNRPLSPSSFTSLLPTMSLLNSTFAAAAASGLVVPSGGNHNNGSSSPVPDGGKLRINSSNSMKTPTSADGDGGRPDSLRSQAATPSSSHPSANNNISNSARSRLMFDPLSELPILEKWFEDNPHPGWLQIEQYTETLNSFPYRQNYPPISTHNVKIWFKNRRAKCKRLNLGDIGSIGGSGGNGKMLLGS